jgi:hypothetical protein
LLNKTLWVSDIGSRQDVLPGCGYRFSATIVEGLRGQQADAGMMVLTIIPREEGLAEGAGIFNRAKPLRELGAILQGLELRLGVGIVIAVVGTAVALGDAQVGQ